jgi:hypothetical protein
MEDMMRKPRDFDAELKALEDRARHLKSRKVLGLGELVIATGADALTADELAGALMVVAETKDAGKREAWAKRGAAFFQGRSRSGGAGKLPPGDSDATARPASTPDRNTGSASTLPSGTQPPPGGTGAA